MVTMQPFGNNNTHRNTLICFLYRGVESVFFFFFFPLVCASSSPCVLIQMARGYRWGALQLVFILILYVHQSAAKKKSVIDYDEKDVQRVYKEWLVSE